MEKEPKRKRPIQKKVRFSQDEWGYLKNKIDESPYNNFQNFARIMLITGEIVHVDYSELRTLNQEVGRIGNNVNQMDRLANNDFISIEKRKAKKSKIFFYSYVRSLKKCG